MDSADYSRAAARNVAAAFPARSRRGVVIGYYACIGRGVHQRCESGPYPTRDEAWAHIASDPVLAAVMTGATVVVGPVYTERGMIVRERAVAA